LQSGADFNLHQLTAVSAMWTIIPLSINLDSHQDVTEKTIIPSRQTTFIYFKIQKARSVSSAPSLKSPEAWTSESLTKLLHNNNNDTYDSPPPINLLATKIPFVRQITLKETLHSY
jgi:hypothetical protein